jgi:type I restriction enzyme, R subunit
VPEGGVVHAFVFRGSGISGNLVADYKRDLKFFTELRATARRDAQETVDYSGYEKQLRRLVDKHVVGTEIREPEGRYDISEPLFAAEPSKWSDEKTRNETDLIRTRIRKTIETGLADDPYAQKVFSELLKQAIAEADALFDHPRKQFGVFKAFDDKVAQRDVGDMPESLARSPKARAYFGAIRLALGETASKALGTDEAARLADEALAIERVVDAAVAEHSLNLRDMEAAIRNGLLPGLFQRLGMDKAKEVADRVVQITRVHLAREAAG